MNLRKISFTFLFSVQLLSAVYAQDDITNLLKAGVDDFNKLSNAYLRPAANSFAIGLGSNWFNTAEVHKVGGFDVNIGVGVVQAAESDRFFDLTSFSKLRPSVGGQTQAPTFAGSGDGVVLNLMQPQFLADKVTPNPLYNNGKGTIVSFNTPQGVSKYIPTASIQLTVGLPIINDVSIRLLPKVSYDGFEMSMWGVGLKHDFKRWIPGLKSLPFDAAAMVAYSKLNMNYQFSDAARITPEKLVSDPNQLSNPNPSVTYKDQHLEANSNALIANIIVSKKLLFFTPYASLGMMRTHFDLTMAGNYPTLGNPTLVGTDVKFPVENLTNPIKIEADEVMTNLSLGFRLKFLAVLTFHGQYTFQKYPVATVGFGLSIR